MIARWPGILLLLAVSAAGSGNVGFVAGPGPYQVNQVFASLDINGLQSNGISAAVTTVGGPAPLSLNVGGIPGQPWDLAWTSDGSLIPSGFVTANGQIINIDLASFGYLFGGAFTNSFFSFSLPFTLPSIFCSFEAQIVIVNPVSPDGFSLSQAIQIQ